MGGCLIGREQAALIVATTGTDLVATADSAPAAGQVADEFGARHYLDYGTMLDEMRPDGVIITD